jgi:protein involved in sex pheromone biosynthesis
MSKPQTLEDLKRRESALLKKLSDSSLKRQGKRYNKRALARIRKQIKEMSP